MENSRSENQRARARDERPQLPPETFSPNRWVPCLVEPDDYCLHYGCQAMEPLEEPTGNDAVEDVPGV